MIENCTNYSRERGKDEVLKLKLKGLKVPLIDGTWDYEINSIDYTRHLCKPAGNYYN